MAAISSWQPPPTGQNAYAGFLFHSYSRAFPDAAAPAETGPAIDLLSDHQAVEAKLTELLTHAIHQASGEAPDLS